MSGRRFAPEVESALRAAGWAPGRLLEPEAVAAMREAVATRPGRFGARLVDTGFADPVLAEFGGLVLQTGPDGSPPRLELDPALARHHIETLVDAGRALGVKLCPVGMEGSSGAVWAVTETGSVLAIDPTGEWLLGSTIEEALELLLTGGRPGRAVPAEPPERWCSLDSPAGAAFFLPRTPANLPYVWLPEVLVRIGIAPVANPADPGRFWVPDWGGLECEVRALDLDRHTVLVLAFAAGSALPEAEPQEDLPAVIPVLTPLARAFRLACVALTPELVAGFVHPDPAPDLLRLIAEREPDVVAGGVALLDHDLGPLYLSDRAGPPAGVAGSRQEAPMAGGRLFLAPAG